MTKSTNICLKTSLNLRTGGSSMNVGSSKPSVEHVKDQTTLCIYWQSVTTLWHQLHFAQRLQAGCCTNLQRLQIKCQYTLALFHICAHMHCHTRWQFSICDFNSLRTIKTQKQYQGIVLIRSMSHGMQFLYPLHVFCILKQQQASHPPKFSRQVYKCMCTYDEVSGIRSSIYHLSFTCSKVINP